MNPIFTFCGYYCGFLAAIGIFFFTFLLILQVQESHFLKHLFDIADGEENEAVGAFVLAIGVISSINLHIAKLCMRICLLWMHIFCQ